jgi:hypothetical protein
MTTNKPEITPDKYLRASFKEHVAAEMEGKGERFMHEDDCNVNDDRSDFNDADPGEYTPFSKEAIQKALMALPTVSVHFIKGDGTIRKMNCTIHEQLIPEAKRPKGTGKAIADHIQRVFDVDIQEWRSFKYDSVVAMVTDKLEY